MSDDRPDEPAAPTVGDDAGPVGDDGGSVGDDGGPAAGPRDVEVAALVTYLKWGGLVALAVLAVVAGVGIYTSISAIIEVWVADYYQPLARAAFNLAVLCVAVAGIFVLLRRV